MSMTDLKAFGETPRIGARKFPAAPALVLLLSSSYMWSGYSEDLHDIVNTAQL